jgi:hypothetical protein
MPLSSEEPDTLCQDLLQDLPSEPMVLAYEFQAFTRPRQIKTRHQLLRVVLLNYGLDPSTALPITRRVLVNAGS